MENYKKRCSWAKTKQYIIYHDQFWGKPVHDDKLLFKWLILESQSCGLGFSVILSKQNAYESAFNFKNIKSISILNEKQLKNKMEDFNIIKSFPKIKSIRINAIAYFNLIKNYNSLDFYLWSKVNFKTTKNHININQNELSKQISKELKRFGFKFLGPILVFSYLQAVGIYDDHEPDCFLYKKK